MYAFYAHPLLRMRTHARTHPYACVHAHTRTHVRMHDHVLAGSTRKRSSSFGLLPDKVASLGRKRGVGIMKKFFGGGNKAEPLGQGSTGTDGGAVEESPLRRIQVSFCPPHVRHMSSTMMSATCPPHVRHMSTTCSECTSVPSVASTFSISAGRCCATRCL